MLKRILSSSLVLLLVCSFNITTNAESNMERTAADALYTLDLFKGTGIDSNGLPIYDLDKIPTRQEAITMLVRLLGKENEAKEGTWSTPFTDVDNWAKPYVGYAYNHKLTSGTSKNTFGGRETISASQYITFILRTLGYSSEKDFAWDSAWTLSDTLGITNREYSATSNFTRGDIVKISYNTLFASLKDTSSTLLSTLLSNGAVSLENIITAGLENALNHQEKILSAADISKVCSPAVFYIEVYLRSDDYPKYPYASGSGFFISQDGVALTCYHVLKDTHFATVTTIDGRVHEITNVIYADEDLDIAIIRVSENLMNGDFVNSFSYLPMKTSDEINNGSTCYAIGSPLGLSNTISNGIISNSLRNINNQNYIQTTTPISPGSSGGALVNEYGEAIGITSSQIEGGQNLNFAIPLDSVLLKDFKSQGITYTSFFIDNDNISNKATGSECYYITNLKTFTTITEKECTASFIMGVSEWNDGYVEGGHYSYEYSYEQQALDELQEYLDYLINQGYKELEYSKQIDPISKDYYINAKYSDGTETIKIAYYNYFKSIRIDPPYKKFGTTLINNTLSYYSEFPRVPDAGTFFNLELIDKGMIDNDYFYVYKAIGLPEGAPTIYTTALSDSGFAYSYTNEYGDSVYMAGSLHVTSYIDEDEKGYYVVMVSD